MSRPVTLFDNEGQALGNVKLPSSYPATPKVLKYKGKMFVFSSVNPKLLPGTVGYEAYEQAGILALADGALVSPNVVP